MKKHTFVLLALFLLSACQSSFDKAMKSAEKDFILTTANDYFAKKKWNKALPLYERLSKLVAGTDDAADVVFNSAYANYYNKDYKLAGHQFKNFSVTFVKDKRKEEAAYMSAMCYYKGSMEYNLDQSTTDSAINELQNFLNNYPNSERATNINDLVEELTDKQEYKAYKNAQQYFKMGQYKAANTAFENVLNDFPSTKLRVSIYDYMMKSRYELAMHSIFDLKDNRLENAIAFSKQMERELPNTDEAKNALKLRKNLTKEIARFAQEKKEIEAQQALLTERQKRRVAKLEAQKKTRKQLDEQVKAERKAEEIKRDSAKLATPTPAATFRIKR